MKKVLETRLILKFLFIKHSHYKKYFLIVWGEKVNLKVLNTTMPQCQNTTMPSSNNVVWVSKKSRFM